MLELVSSDDFIYEYQLIEGTIQDWTDFTDSYTGCEYKGQSGILEIPPSGKSGFLLLIDYGKLWLYDGRGKFECEYTFQKKCPDEEGQETQEAHYWWWYTGPTTSSPTVDAPATQIVDSLEDEDGFGYKWNLSAVEE